MLDALRLRHKHTIALSACALVLAAGSIVSCSGAASVGGTVAPPAGSAQPTVSTSPTASVSGTATSGAAVGFTPPRRGPGAVLTFDPKTAPVVPKAMSVNAYIDSYYRALIDGRWAEAFNMVPKTSPKQGLADFKSLQYGYEVRSFRIMGPGVGAGVRVLVVHVTPANDVWNTTWEFVKGRRGVLVKDLTYARPGGGGCH